MQDICSVGTDHTSKARITLSKSPSGYVLKFISGKYQGGEFPLEMDTEIIIGRSSDLSMVLVEDMVSRQHSKITTHGGELFIEDLGSTNGTFVNGEKITRKRLKGGDRILVGTSIIKLVQAGAEDEDSGAGGGHDIRELPEDSYQPDSIEPTVGIPEPPRRSTQPTSTTGSISGLIEEVPLPDLLQLFSTSKKTGSLVLQHQSVRAEMLLREGRIYYARINTTPDISPYKAFYRLLAWNQGTFSLEIAAEEAFDEEMEGSTEALLMEGMRQLDEIANLGAIPRMNQTISISQPLLPPLRALTPELLDTMQLIHNCTTVESVLNTSLASDLETLQDIVYLLQHEYVFVQG